MKVKFYTNTTKSGLTFSLLSDDMEFAEMVYDEVDKVGQNSEQIHQIHRLDEESHPARGADQSEMGQIIWLKNHRC